MTDKRLQFRCHGEDIQTETPEPPSSSRRSHPSLPPPNPQFHFGLQYSTTTQDGFPPEGTLSDFGK